jgi:hypothetical protein
MHRQSYQTTTEVRDSRSFRLTNEHTRTEPHNNSNTTWHLLILSMDALQPIASPRGTPELKNRTTCRKMPEEKTQRIKAEPTEYLFSFTFSRDLVKSSEKFSDFFVVTCYFFLNHQKVKLKLNIHIAETLYCEFTSSCHHAVPHDPTACCRCRTKSPSFSHRLLLHHNATRSFFYVPVLLIDFRENRFSRTHPE